MEQAAKKTFGGSLKGKRPPHSLTMDEMEALIEANSKTSTNGLRARALLAVMGYAGLRAAEAVALRPHDVDVDAGTVFVRNGKGDQHRTAPMFKEGKLHLDRWLRRR